MRPMAKRVLIFSTAYLPLIGGAELAVKELTDRLSDYEFDLITAKLKPELKSVEQMGRVKVYRLGWGSGLDKLILAFYGATFATKLHRQNKYDLVWGIMASFAGLAAAGFKQKTGTPFLLTLQEGDNLAEVESKMAPLWWKFKNIFNSADHVQCISNYLAEWARKMGVVAPITVVPNGVDLKTFYCNQCQQERLNDNEEKIIFTASRLVKKNAVDVIIEALAKLPTNFKLRIAGTGEEERALKNLVKDLGVGERVEFLGNLDKQQVAQQLIKADIFTRPSRSEGLGNSFLEAFAAGVPVITTSVGGITDFLKDNETGFLVPVDDATALAEKIKFVASQPNKQQVWAVTNAARDLVRQTYNWDTLAPQMAQILNQL